MSRAKLRPKWGQHGSWMPLQEQLVQNTKTFKNSVESFKNEASRLVTWQQQGCEKAKKQYQEAMIFEMDFVIGFGTVWGRFWRPTWGRKWTRNRSKMVLEDGCLWKTLSRGNLGRVGDSDPPISSGRGPRGPPNYQDRNQIPGLTCVSNTPWPKGRRIFP